MTEPIERWTEAAAAPAFWAACAAAAAATWALARLAPRLGLVDGARPRDAARKLQPRPVPPVGGLAVLVGLAAGGLLWTGGGAASFVGTWPAPGYCACALAAAFLVGLVDDWLADGLDPAAKLAGQCAAGLPLGLGAWAAQPELSALEGAGLLAASALASAVAQNAVNTFDNADGAAAGLGILGLVGPAPAAAGALLGFLPFNLDRAPRRPPEPAPPGPRERAAPSSYLGDSGSHLLGMLILITPAAWPALWLPLLDLARVALARTRDGQAPWIGDRRHLAHRLERRGLDRARTLVVLLVLSAPAVGLGLVAHARGNAWYALVGGALTAAVYALALVATRGTRSSTLPSSA